MQDPRDLKCGDIFYTEEGKFKVDKEVETLFVEEHTGLTFGDALKKLKQGFRIARKGWDGKGMWLKLVTKGNFDVGIDTVSKDCIGLDPWIGMFTAGKTFIPWLVSQADALATDWEIVGLK